MMKPAASLLSQSLARSPSRYKTVTFFAMETEAGAGLRCHIIHLLFTAEGECRGKAVGARWNLL